MVDQQALHLSHQRRRKMRACSQEMRYLAENPGPALGRAANHHGIGAGAGQHVAGFLGAVDVAVGHHWNAQGGLHGEKFERFEAVFAGAGDTLSAALSALLANGHDLQAATAEALTFLDHSLDAGFHPGMGNIVPDRLFWAQADVDAEDDESGEETGDANDDVELTSKPSLDLPPNGTTKH